MGHPALEAVPFAEDFGMTGEIQGFFASLRMTCGYDKAFSREDPDFRAIAYL